MWKEAKVIPPFAGSYSSPITLLPVLSKLMERIVFDQIQCYFSEKNSTCTALMQITDNWLK
jgi:formylmethanofuran dehydrogenase subunit E-like metal-binding protein